MISNFILTGDTHGASRVFTRLQNIFLNTDLVPEETAVIILGDAGLNFWLNHGERSWKKKMQKEYPAHIYCVRGNHEERPENLNFPLEYDENVCGDVYVDPDNELIRYFMDGGQYNINGHSVLVIGGAYSVDKHYRLMKCGMTEETNESKLSGWFDDEQLTAFEQRDIDMSTYGKHFDFVLTHTCPISWEPRDLFLDFVDQSSVDKSMELWLDKVKDHISWNVWCFGHYHADRIERPFVEQFYNRYATLDYLWSYWNGEEVEARVISKSPLYYAY